MPVGFPPATLASLGAGTIATQNANAVAITGGSILLGIGGSAGTGKVGVAVGAPQTTQVGNAAATATETNFMSSVLNGAAFITNGQEGYGFCAGAVANTINPKTIKIYLTDGVTNSLIGTLAMVISLAGQNWKIDYKFTRTGANTQQCVVVLARENAGATETETITITNTTLLEANTLTVQVTGTVTDGGGGIVANELVQNYMDEFFVNV